MARPWRLDDAVEQATLFAQAPGFHATLPHTFDRQPRA